jgi:hypothetical protein
MRSLCVGPYPLTMKIVALSSREYEIGAGVDGNGSHEAVMRLSPLYPRYNTRSFLVSPYLPS